MADRAFLKGALCVLAIRSAADRKIEAYIHVNNRLEGNAIETIAAVA
jgi:hypothetical protein